jgi:hypothetical protein
MFKYFKNITRNITRNISSYDNEMTHIFFALTYVII